MMRVVVWCGGMYDKTTNKAEEGAGHFLITKPMSIFMSIN